MVKCIVAHMVWYGIVRCASHMVKCMVWYGPYGAFICFAPLEPCEGLKHLAACLDQLAANWRLWNQWELIRFNFGLLSALLGYFLLYYYYLTHSNSCSLTAVAQIAASTSTQMQGFTRGQLTGPGGQIPNPDCLTCFWNCSSDDSNHLIKRVQTPLATSRLILLTQ